MELGVSYHNHSTWSDGTGELEEMVLAARQAGFRAFGMSDHFVPHPTLGEVDWGMPEARLRDYVARLQDLKAQLETPDFHLMTGLEVDYFPENHVEIVHKLRQLPLDYLIGSVHYVDEFPIDNSAEDWEALGSSQACDAIIHRYWQRELGLCRSGLYDIVGHLDLTKKYGYYPSYDVSGEVDAALQALKASGMKMEVNTAGWDKTCQEAYPSREILSKAIALGIPLVLSTDAHGVDQVTRHLNEGMALIRDCGGQIEG